MLIYVLEEHLDWETTYMGHADASVHVLASAFEVEVFCIERARTCECCERYKYSMIIVNS